MFLAIFFSMSPVSIRLNIATFGIDAVRQHCPIDLFFLPVDYVLCLSAWMWSGRLECSSPSLICKVSLWANKRFFMPIAPWAIIVMSFFTGVLLFIDFE